MESLLVLVVHHIVCDAWGLQVLSTDLSASLEAALALHTSAADSEHAATTEDAADQSSGNAVSQKLVEKAGQPPLQQMDYSAWICQQLVSFWLSCPRCFQQ